MSLRIATFNIENLVNRFDFSGFRNNLRADRVIKLFDIKTEHDYKTLEAARVIATTDDTRQLSALAIADADADILCLQEVDSLEALKSFEYGYLFRMMGAGYRQHFLVEGNDSRGIDVAVLLRSETRHGEPIEVVDVHSHAALTYQDLDLYDPELGDRVNPRDRVFKRDCLELELRIGGRPLTVYVVHFKSMTSGRGEGDGRTQTMPIRIAEAKAVRQIIEKRFADRSPVNRNFVICGDMNDYQERVIVRGDRRHGYEFIHQDGLPSALDVFTDDGFAVNPMNTRDPLDRWTLYHARGPEEQHLCQLDYILLSQHLAGRNVDVVPDIIRNGQPFRSVFPPGYETERYPRIGWDRPKASDHCPVVMELFLP
ncbi:endonuclease/exonuclease/phosphatase family protein [Peteryoungia desertarenae]|uniref:Endonuclease/exonuclease/phosphatase family protein n=1 Tax=Peteryoungia desertarenae TaxID=1813451 RepID=A0ABX6QQD7_9HYPH|nr:endonuclease/exonuclease/phosphatase family protein [Peteryoungia desertarenae]QLF70773.1 endonuclease/exonuclease/phosphatase family protein [Peteryoungia desertarenae]